MNPQDQGGDNGSACIICFFWVGQLSPPSEQIRTWRQLPALENANWFLVLREWRGRATFLAHTPSCQIQHWETETYDFEIPQKPHQTCVFIDQPLALSPVFRIWQLTLAVCSSFNLGHLPNTVDVYTMRFDRGIFLTPSQPRGLYQGLLSISVRSVELGLGNQVVLWVYFGFYRKICSCPFDLSTDFLLYSAFSS